MKFDCPSCGKTLNVKDEFAGKKAKCPGCMKVLVVPSASDSGSSASVAGVCGGCGKKLPTGALICVQCGFDTRTGRKLSTRFD